MEYELYICPVVVGPFRDFSPKIKKKIFEVFRCFGVSIKKNIFLRCFGVSFRCFGVSFRCFVVRNARNFILKAVETEQTM